MKAADLLRRWREAAHVFFAVYPVDELMSVNGRADSSGVSFHRSSTQTAADRYTATRLSAQPASRSAPIRHTHTNLQSGSQRSCWEGMTIAVVHHICSKIFGMCTRADASTKTDSESRGRLCPDKLTTTCSAAWGDVVSARPHLMTWDKISAVIIIFVCLHRESFRALTGTENWESPKLLRQCFYPVWDSFSVRWNIFRCILT